MERDAELEVVLLGTGTSSQVPALSCLTAPEGQGCQCCLSTLRPEGSKNLRRNTSAIVKIRQSGTSTKTILIDVGKSFCEAAREHFPRNSVRRLDAVLLTHPHADAINGLDDLRSLTLGGVIQDHVDVYCNAYTYQEIERMFPYMCSPEKVTGGGDVPAFKWHILDEKPFELFGVTITPLQVHHGTFFSGPERTPYTCLAYLFGRTFLYMADVSHIPDSTLSILDTVMTRSDPPHLPVLILDCLRIAMHFSHFGIQQAVLAAERLRAQRTYLVGFAHRISHDTWVHCCEAIGRGQKPRRFADDSYTPAVQGATSASETAFKRDDADAFTEEALREIYSYAPPSFDAAPWIRPAFDGLRLFIDSDGRSWDSDYILAN